MSFRPISGFHLKVCRATETKSLLGEWRGCVVKGWMVEKRASRGEEARNPTHPTRRPFRFPSRVQSTKVALFLLVRLFVVFFFFNPREKLPRNTARADKPQNHRVPVSTSEGREIKWSFKERMKKKESRGKFPLDIFSTQGPTSSGYGRGGGTSARVRCGCFAWTLMAVLCAREKESGTRRTTPRRIPRARAGRYTFLYISLQIYVWKFIQRIYSAKRRNGPSLVSSSFRSSFIPPRRAAILFVPVSSSPFLCLRPTYFPFDFQGTCWKLIKTPSSWVVQRSKRGSVELNLYTTNDNNDDDRYSPHDFYPGINFFLTSQA